MGHCWSVAVVTDLELLEVHRGTAFTFDGRGRMVYESAPDCSPGRRFSFTGCQEGNLAVVRHDVSDLVARELQRLVALEPPLVATDSVPVHLERYRALLDVDGSAVEHHHGLLWAFPGPLTYDVDVDVVWSGTRDGDRLLARFAEVVPASLREKGFGSPADLWAPWCVATVDGEVASIAETVRRGSAGAEVGVDTAIGLRGRGLGAAVTASWSQHPELQERVLFYSTSRENMSSRRVTERLHLRPLGSTFAVS